MHIIEQLKSRSVFFDKGLTDNEIENIQKRFEIQFPPDLLEFLSTALPISNGFINWRNSSIENINVIKDKLKLPLEGILFDIEHNSFWFEGWGSKPNNLLESLEICKEKMNQAPQLIPIYFHRFIPQNPFERNNPIFSVHQTDIIYYGENLFNYLEIEFGIKGYKDIDFESIKTIPFWTDIVG
ncbi:SMI1/KNR4 family protein [Cohnella lupini]|uniref:SMI1/KNR4 family protein n=1 Tax=Cohnella lupini TaxID=1294267 RepID=UPI000E221A48|nr:SMI1/KNR4 family protein [Cohnella lupini]